MRKAYPAEVITQPGAIFHKITGLQFTLELFYAASVGETQRRIVFVTDVTVAQITTEAGILVGNIEIGTVGLVVTSKALRITLLIPGISRQCMRVGKTCVAINKIHTHQAIIIQAVRITLSENGSQA